MPSKAEVIVFSKRFLKTLVANAIEMLPTNRKSVRLFTPCRVVLSCVDCCPSPYHCHCRYLVSMEPNGSSTSWLWTRPKTSKGGRRKSMIAHNATFKCIEFLDKCQSSRWGIFKDSNWRSLSRRVKSNPKHLLETYIHLQLCAFEFECICSQVNE